METINKRLKIIGDLHEEINGIKALYEESLENTKEFQEIQEEEKKFKETTKEKKEKVKSSPTLTKMEEEIKNLRKDLKEAKEILSQELADYYKENGTLQIVDADGNAKRIIFSARLVNQ